jgi:hypothetical protein
LPPIVVAEPLIRSLSMTAILRREHHHKVNIRGIRFVP